MGKRKAVFAVGPLERSDNSAGDNEYLLNARREWHLRHTMRTLAQRAIGMRRAVRMNVSHLCSGAEDQKDCKQNYKQKAGIGAARTVFSDP